MEWKIPYFEYDVFARIAPGALTIAVAHYLGMPVPEYWQPLLPPGAAGDLDPGVVFFGGLTLLAASYIIGIINECLFSQLWEYLSPWALRRAATKRTSWLRSKAETVPTVPTVQPLSYKGDDLFKLLHQWLLHSTDEGVRSGFVHVHRFQAETRLCTYSIIPLFVLLIAGFCKGNFWIGGGALVMFPLLSWCAYSREIRRWIQALAVLDERPKLGDKEIDELQQQLEQLGRNANGANKSWVRCCCISWFRGNR